MRTSQVLLVTALLLLLVPDAALARAGEARDKPNPITRIEAVEDADLTRIRIHCARRPTFSVFRLENPARVFVDIAGGDISAVRNTLSVENGVVDRVGTLQFNRKGAAVGRVIVGLSSNAAYDVRRRDKVVEVLVDATERRASATAGKDAAAAAARISELRARIEAEQSKLADLREKREKLSAERARLERDVAGLEKRKKEAERLRGEVDTLEARLAEARTSAAADDARQTALQQTIDRLKRLEADQARATRELAAAKRAEAEAQAERYRLSAAMRGVRQVLSERERALQAARAKASSLETKNARLARSVRKADAAAEAARSRLERERTKHDTKVSTVREEVEALKRAVAEAEQARAKAEREGRNERKTRRNLAELKTKLQKTVDSERRAMAVREAALAKRLAEVDKARGELQGALERQKKQESAVKAAMSERIQSLEARVKALSEMREKERELARARAVLEARTAAREELEGLAKRSKKEREVLAELKARRTEHEQKLAALREELKSKEAGISKLGSAQKKTEVRLSAVRGEVTAWQGKLAKLSGKHRSLQDKIAALEGRSDKLKAERERRVAELSKLRTENTRLNEHVRGLEVELGSLKSRMDEQRQAYRLRVGTLVAERATLSRRIEELDRKAKGGSAEATTLRSRVTELGKQLKAAQAQQQRQIEVLKEERDRFAARLGKMRGIADTVPKHKKRLAELEGTLAELRAASARDVEALRQRMQKEIETREGEISRLKGLIAQAEAKGKARGSNAAELKRRLAGQTSALASARAEAERVRSSLEAKLASERAAAAAARNETRQAKAEADRVRKEAEQARAAARSETRQAKAEADRIRKEAERARAEAIRTRAAAEQAIAEASRTREVAAKAKAEAKRARQDAERTRATLEARLSAEREEVRRRTAEVDRLRTEIKRARATSGNNTEAVTGLEKELANQRAALERAVVEARSTQAELVAQLARERKATALAQEEAASARKAAAEAREQIRELKESLMAAQLSKERDVREREAQVKKLRADLEAARAQGKGSSAERAAIEARLVAENRALRAAREGSEEARQAAEEAKARIRTLRHDLLAAHARMEHEVKTREAEIERLKRLLGETSSTGEAGLKERKRLEHLLAQERAWLEAARGDADDARRAADEARAAVKAMGERLARQTREVDRLRASLAEERQRHTGPVAIEDVRFEARPEGPRILLRASRPFAYDLERKGDRMHLTLHDVRVPPNLERVLDTRAFQGPILEVATFQDASKPSEAHIDVLVVPGAEGEILRAGAEVVWSFPNAKASPEMARSPNEQDVRWSAHGVGAASYGGPVAYGGPPVAPGGPPAAAGAASGGTAAPGGAFQYIDPYFGRRHKKKRYSGRKLNLTIKDADIQHVLTFLAKEGGINIITSEDVSGTVSFHFENVPWDLAMEMVLRSKGLDYIKEEGVYRIAPAGAIQEEFDLELEKRKKLAEFKQLVVKLLPLSYAEAGTMMPQVKDLLSAKGSIGYDKRTNTLIVKDVEEHVIAAEDLIRRLDTQTPQVLIEARIVEAADNFAEEFGIQWGGGYSWSAVYGNDTGLMFPSTVGISGGNDDPTAPTTGLLYEEQPRFAVNMPAATGIGTGTSIGLSMGSFNGAGTLSLRLSTAEERGTAKIISSPRISTLDNVNAKIGQGVSIPISVVSANGVNTQFFQADLKLEVTPHVTPDGNISLKVNITKNEPDFGTRGSSGNPTIQRKEASTELLVKDGETAVIGGVFTRNTAFSKKVVPFFGHLPLVGWMFRVTGTVDKRTELLIFLTPRVVNREASQLRTDT